MYRLIQCEKRLLGWLETHIFLILGSTIFGITVYFMMMAMELSNDLDGIWHTSNFIAGNWEISLGRGLQRYFDKMRFGIVSVPFNTVLTIFIESVAISMIIDLFGVKNKLLKMLVAALLIANPVVCATLSYSYTTVNYALAYLFSVVSVYAIHFFGEKKWYIGSIAGAFFLAVSMGCYQAYIGVTCYLLLGILIRMILDKVKWRRIGMFVVSGGLEILLGGGLYFLLTQALLKRAGIELSSYRGAGNVTLVSILKNFPSSFLECYREFYSYFALQKMYIRLPLIDWIVCALGLIICCALVYQAIELSRHHWTYVVGLVLCIALLPVASNSVILIAVGNAVTMLMAMGMLLVPVYGVLLTKGKVHYPFFLRRILAVLLCLLCWFQMSMVINDQLAMREGKTATIALAENVIQELSAQGYLQGQQVIALVGRPAENDLFAHQPAYENANGYARFGSWSTEAGNLRRSWLGVLNEFCGVNLPMCGEDQYNVLRQLQEVADMPEFPSEGSIREIDGIVVVKISELY